MKTQEIKWQDLTKVLKVGDKVYSYRYGEGFVYDFDSGDTEFPIKVKWNDEEVKEEWFTKEGFEQTWDKFPSIHIQEWNPLTDPFPMPKFEPILGEWYAFWDDDSKQFIVAILGNHTPYKSFSLDGAGWQNCAPIDEALELFKSKNSCNEKATEAI